ncbi:MAG: ABC transporter substrate-binding protein [Bacillota bacterium]
MMKRICLVVLAFALVANIFVGCTQQVAPQVRTKALEKITVVLDWPANTNHTGIYVAKELGFYKEVGLDLEFKQAPDGDPLPMLAAGKGAFGVSSQEMLAMALSANEPLKVKAVAALIQHNTSGIISLKKSNIKSPKDLEGKRYAAWGMPIEKALLATILAKDGGDSSKIKMIPNPVTDLFAALNTNIDAVWVYYGWDGISAEIKKLDFNYFDLKSFAPELDYFTPFLAASDEYLAKNPEQAKKFLAATARGYEYAIANPQAAAKILEKFAPDTDKQIILKSQEYLALQYKAEVIKWGQFDEARWSKFHSWLFANKVTPKDIGAAGFTNEYLP